jgi:hypothetical protein
VTDSRAFLSARTQSVPPTLARRFAQLPLEGGSPALEGLASAGLEALDRARSAPGRIRESAFELLTADALLTYACDAALEGDDPAEALEGLVRRAAEPR